MKIVIRILEGQLKFAGTLQKHKQSGLVIYDIYDINDIYDMI